MQNSNEEKPTNENIWKNTDNRFVAFFDILGFKELVAKQKHEVILKKLEGLKSTINYLAEKAHNAEVIKGFGIGELQVRSITFSDSIVLFSKSNTLEDALKIIIDCNFIIKNSIEAGISIKGGISYGEVTVDFDKSLFFGQAIIDAFLLHEDLHLLTCICDHHFENRIRELEKHELFERFLIKHPTKLKYGKITHTIFRPAPKVTEQFLDSIQGLYKNVSGSARIYLDNTVEFLEFLKIKGKEKK